LLVVGDWWVVVIGDQWSVVGGPRNKTSEVCGDFGSLIATLNAASLSDHRRLITDH